MRDGFLEVRRMEKEAKVKPLSALPCSPRASRAGRGPHSRQDSRLMGKFRKLQHAVEDSRPPDKEVLGYTKAFKSKLHC
jgi:hypothetical protein